MVAPPLRNCCWHVNACVALVCRDPAVRASILASVNHQLPPVFGTCCVGVCLQNAPFAIMGSSDQLALYKYGEQCQCRRSSDHTEEQHSAAASLSWWLCSEGWDSRTQLCLLVVGRAHAGLTDSLVAEVPHTLGFNMWSHWACACLFIWCCRELQVPAQV